MIVTWKPWTQKPSCESFGHGVRLHDTEVAGGEDDSLVAFVDGFAWHHGASDEVVIYCIERNNIIPRVGCDEEEG